MRNTASVRLGVILVAAVHSARAADPGDTVTLPRWRYEELLRKEAEWERLRSGTNGLSVPAAQRTNSPAPTDSRATESPHSPSLPTSNGPAQPLVRLREDALIAASDLARHFVPEPARAAQALEGLRIRVRGRIAGFEKPLLTERFHVLLETGLPNVRIRCIPDLPEDLRGVYTAEAGTVLMAVHRSGSRRPFLRLGQEVLLTGKIRGLKGQVIELTGCRLSNAP